MIALLTAFSGAFAGACGAYWIVNRVEGGKQTLTEIRNVNAAIMLVASVFETHFVQKKQHFHELKTSYDQIKKAALEARSQAAADERLPGHLFTFSMDFRSFNPVPAPFEHINALIFSQMSVSARVITLTTTLERTHNALNTLVEQRNAFIDDFKKNRDNINHDERSALYFGFPNVAGHTDETYRDMIDGIYGLCDDCIAFSMLLADELTAYGKQLADRYGRKAPVIWKMDISEAQGTGLLPDLTQYADYLSIPAEKAQ